MTEDNTTIDYYQAPISQPAEVDIQSKSHGEPLYAEPLYSFGGFDVTNSIINSWVAVVVLISIFFILGKKIKKIPAGAQNIFEIVLEEALNLADTVTESRKKTEKFLPLALAIFFFVLVNNWLGIVPGVGSIALLEIGAGHSEAIPLFRGGTADLNTTLALSLFAVIATHIFGVFTIGFWNHFNKFINLKVLMAIPREIKKDFSVILVNPIKAFVGIVEIISEAAKVASLSFRLFGNVFAGEVLIGSMMAISAFVLPVPFLLMEVLVGLIQALIFSILTMVFMTIATSHEEH